MSGPPRVLVVRLSAIGDVIVSTPVSRALREAFPQAWIGWVVERPAAELLAANPYLDEVIVWDRPRGTLPLRSLAALGRRLRAHRPGWAVDLQGNLRSALVCRASGARRIVGNSGAREGASLFYTHRVARRTDDLSSRQRCLDLLQPLGIRTEDRRGVVHLTDEDRTAAAARLDRLGLGEQPFCALAPATTWPQKHWFPESWAGLVRLLRERTDLAPLLLGGPGDRELAAGIGAAAGGEVPSLVGETTLRQAAAVLERASVCVAVDTGLMHLAQVMGTPAVCLAGASWWPGFADYERFRLLREPLPCSPCLHRPTCGGRFDCMRALTPEAVLHAVMEVRSGAAREGSR